MTVAYLYKHANNIFTTERKDESKTDLQSGEVLEFAMYLAELYDEVRIISEDRTDIEHFTDKIKVGSLYNASNSWIKTENFADADLIIMNSVKQDELSYYKILQVKFARIIYAINDIRLIDNRIVDASDIILSQAYNIGAYFCADIKASIFNIPLELLALRHHYNKQYGIEAPHVDNSDMIKQSIYATSMNMNDYSDFRIAQFMTAANHARFNIIGSDNGKISNAFTVPCVKWSALPAQLAKYQHAFIAFDYNQLTYSLMPNRVIEALMLNQVCYASIANEWISLNMNSFNALKEESSSSVQVVCNRVLNHVCDFRGYTLSSNETISDAHIWLTKSLSYALFAKIPQFLR